MTALWFAPLRYVPRLNSHEPAFPRNLAESSVKAFNRFLAFPDIMRLPMRRSLILFLLIAAIGVSARGDEKQRKRTRRTSAPAETGKIAIKCPRHSSAKIQAAQTCRTP